MFLLLPWLSAQAAPPAGSDVAITSVGAQVVHSTAVGENDIDMLLSERARLTFVDKETFKARLLADARFTIDTDGVGDSFEWNNVRQLGVQLHRPSWTLDLGRHPVYRGGPRIVDGAQLLFHPSQRVDVGVWGGLAPDLFSTRPILRPGGGPVVSYVTSSFQASLVGEALIYDGGLDRLASLAMIRGSLDRVFELSGRADVEYGENGPHLADLYAMSIYRPTDAVRFDLFYNGFSSYKYQLSELQDPKVQRFSKRIVQLGIDLAVTQEALDPSFNHLVGAGTTLQPDTNGRAAPRVQLDVRQRFNENELNRFTRLHAQTGIVDIGLAGRLDLLADGSLIFADGDTQLNPGLMALWEPGDEGWFAIDLSGRALINPEYDGKMGWYGDLFLDAITPINLSVNVGVSAFSEPDPDIGDVPDLGLQAYGRLTYYLRP